MSTLLKEIINWYASQLVGPGCDWDLALGDDGTSETPRAKFQAHTSLNEQETAMPSSRRREEGSGGGRENQQFAA